MSTRRIISADVKLVEDFTYDQNSCPLISPLLSTSGSHPLLRKGIIDSQPQCKMRI